jgi:hypothetical protein
MAYQFNFISLGLALAVLASAPCLADESTRSSTLVLRGVITSDINNEFGTGNSGDLFFSTMSLSQMPHWIEVREIGNRKPASEISPVIAESKLLTGAERTKIKLPSQGRWLITILVP